MSNYEDYETVSKCYDDDRTPEGADIIAGLLFIHGGKPLKDVHVLDAGCGTGNYAKALIDYGVGKVTLMDASHNMLSKARYKLKDAIDKKIVDQVIEAKLPKIPVEDGTFDMVLYSLVLHHVDNTGNGKQFPAMEEAFKEAKRVLRPGGIMVVTEGLPYALRYSLWFTQLHVEATDKWCKLFPTLDQYKAMFDKCGFNLVSKLNTLGLHWLNHYYDPEYPLREEWRSGSSYFGFTTDDEIRQIEEKCRKMIADNTIDDFIKQHDQVSEAGVLTILACKSL